MVTIQTAPRNDLGPIAVLDTMALGESSRRPCLSNAVRGGQFLVANSRQRVVGFAVMDQSFYGHGFMSLLIVHPEHRPTGFSRRGQIENLDEGDPEIVYFKRLPNKAAEAETGRNMP